MRTVYYWDEESNCFTEGKRVKSEGGLTIIPDEIEATEHPIDRKVYTSRSKFDEVTKLHGCEPISKDEVRRLNERRSINVEPRERFQEVLKRTIEEMQSGRQQAYEPPKHVQDMWKRVKNS